MPSSTRTGTLMLLFLAVAITACPLGRGSKQLGEECWSNNDCASVRCNNNCGGPSCREKSFCTASCKTDADCASKVAVLSCKRDPASSTDPEARGLCALVSPPK